MGSAYGREELRKCRNDKNTLKENAQESQRQLHNWPKKKWREKLELFRMTQTFRKPAAKGVESDEMKRKGWGRKQSKMRPCWGTLQHKGEVGMLMLVNMLFFCEKWGSLFFVYYFGPFCLYSDRTVESDREGSGNCLGSDSNLGSWVYDLLYDALALRDEERRRQATYWDLYYKATVQIHC